MTYQLTQGVTKNIIPAIPSTNAIVAAACTLEALKLITTASTGMNNYMMCDAAQITDKSPSTRKKSGRVFLRERR